MKDFLRAGHFATLSASLLHFETSFMVWVLFGGLGVLIASDLGLSASEKGLLVGIPLLGGALTRVPIGWLGDRYGPKRIGFLTLGFVLLPLATAWLLPPSRLELMAIGAVLGIAGSSFAIALPLASRWYPARYQGTALGIAAAGNSGAVLANLLAPRLGESLGWQAVFGLALVPVALTLCVFGLAAREAPNPVTTPADAPRDWRVLREADLWWFCFIYSLTFGGYVGFSSFLSMYFHDTFGLPAVAAGALAAACSVAGSFMRPVGGVLADRMGGIRILSVVFAAVPILLLAPMASAPLWAVSAALAIAMACLGIGNGATFQLMPQRFSAQIGFATGLVGAAGGLGGFLLPAIMGFQYEAARSYSPGFLICIMAFGAGFLVLQALQAGALSPWWAGANVPAPPPRTPLPERLASYE